MMQQYDEAKEVCGDALLLFRMGDFYELFYEDAKLAAQALSITLTSRDKGENPIPMAGFPHHQLDGYLAKLIQLGFRVAVCDQVEDARQAKGLVRREVTRVVTPGTLTDDALLDPRTSNYLMSIVFQPQRSNKEPAATGIAWAELSTGEFFLTTIDPATLSDVLQRIGPAECLVNEDDRVLQDSLHEMTLTQRPSWCFGHESAIETLHRHFGVTTLEGYGVQPTDTAAVRAAGAIIEYLLETQKTSLSHIHRLQVVRHQEALAIDQATWRSLELTHSLRDFSKSGTLLEVIDNSVTAMGGRVVARWLTAPLAKRFEIEARLDAVQNFVADGNLTSDVRGELREVYDLQRLLSRVSTGRASPRDLQFVGATLRRLPPLKSLVAEQSSPLIQTLHQQIDPCEELCDALAKALVDDCPLTTKEGGIIRRGYDEELDRLRDLSSGGKQWLAEYQQQQQARTGIPNLKIGFNKVFGFYIEVTNSHRDKVPDDFIRKQTLKNAERFITPELKEYEHRVLSAEEKANDLEYALFVKLRDHVQQHYARLRASADALAQIDVLAGFADLAVRRSYCRPQLEDLPTLDIRDGRHPVLDAIYPTGKFVPNDVLCRSETDRILLITGPNMAGKSTYIRQVALLTIMAQMGCYVPANEARIGIADRIFARVGASDEISKGQSTFMVEMTETARILNTATERSLVILDEIGRGTSTYDGVSLAWAILEHLHHELNCRTLFATHYHELTALADTNDRITNLNVAVREKENDVVFLHRIVPGAADKSYGIHVAKLAGVPPSVNQRAEDILQWLESSRAADEQPREEAPPPAPHGSADDKKFQLTFFETAEHPLIQEIRDIRIDECAPMEALLKLKNWQSQLADKNAPTQPR